jgi:4-hydroxy-2-oxoheptanedioate aldolase
MNWCKDKIHDVEISKGLFIAGDSVPQVEISARAGFDWLMLDMEHGLADEMTIRNQIEVIRHFPVSPLVRIPSLRSDIIKRALDFGAAGIMVPMVANANQAREFVAALRYPPDGIRGLSSGSMAAGFGYEAASYLKEANRKVTGIVQIENREGVEAADEIASIEGVDVLFIGHSDLSLGLGCYNDFSHPEMLEAEQIVVSACKKHNKIAGMLLKESMDPTEYQTRGFKFLAYGTDLSVLRRAVAKLL